MRALLLVAIIAAAASAGGANAYRIHPTSGDFVVTTHPCGADTRDQIYEVVAGKNETRIIVDGDRVTIERRNLPDLTTRETKPADGNLSIEATFRFGPSKTLTVSLARGESIRKVDITLRRQLDEIVCAERWQGRAEK